MEYDIIIPELITSSILIIIFLIYLIPSIVANRRKHKNLSIIMLLNFLVGWTVVGWIGVLIWAIKGKIKHTEVKEKGNFS